MDTWEVLDKTRICKELGPLLAETKGPGAESLAAQIVREHNAHEALVEALGALIAEAPKGATRETVDGRTFSAAMAMARDALAEKK
ncbi:MAG: hypothetical protein Q7K03_04230 [Dehalococcoidia bacterium]|nr:hypothetical protein [Dehalococcoidia bacterium]